jgi:acyl-CoA reductase-like NAD-dependent aldehyde dehydrogenase
MVSITGSVRAGMEVARSAEGIAGAGYFNAGQDCTAATRVLAGPGIAADRVAAVTGGLDVPEVSGAAPRPFSRC